MKKKVMVKIMNNIIEQIQKRLVECDEYLAKSKVDNNYHMCQGQRQIYASALERPDAISPGFVQSLISENESRLTQLSKKVDILKHQGILLALQHIKGMVDMEYSHRAPTRDDEYTDRMR